MLRSGLGILVLVIIAVLPHPAAAGPGVTCGGSAPPDCGGEAGDATCLDGNQQADPLQDCIALDANTCGCRPRVCCTCETASGSGTTCDLPCTDAGALNLFACVGLCFAADLLTGDACNLEVVARAECADGNCPTTGCCAFEFCNSSVVGGVCQDQGGFSGLCAETDEATCNSLDLTLDEQARATTFVAGGSCDSLFGACVAPTATATPTSTPTATSTATGTATATSTGTVTHTPTSTPVPQGGDCTTPSQCATGFCVDGVCCDSACDQPGQICDQIDDPGVCGLPLAPAPTLSGRALWLALLALVAVAATALLQRRRAG